MDIHLGDLVAFKKGLYADEEGAIYRVLEINGDRAVIELENTDMVIQPQSIALISEIELVQNIKPI